MGCALASLTCRGSVVPGGGPGVWPRSHGGRGATWGLVQETTPPNPQAEVAPPHCARGPEKTTGRKPESRKHRAKGSPKLHAEAVRQPLTASPRPSDSLRSRHLPRDTDGAPSLPRASCAQPQSISITNTLRPALFTLRFGKKTASPTGHLAHSATCFLLPPMGGSAA